MDGRWAHANWCWRKRFRWPAPGSGGRPIFLPEAKRRFFASRLSKSTSCSGSPDCAAFFAAALVALAAALPMGELPEFSLPVRRDEPGHRFMAEATGASIPGPGALPLLGLGALALVGRRQVLATVEHDARRGEVQPAQDVE